MNISRTYLIRPINVRCSRGSQGKPPNQVERTEQRHETEKEEGGGGEEEKSEVGKRGNQEEHRHTQGRGDSLALIGRGRGP